MIGTREKKARVHVAVSVAVSVATVALAMLEMTTATPARSATRPEAKAPPRRVIPAVTATGERARIAPASIASPVSLVSVSDEEERTLRIAAGERRLAEIERNDPIFVPVTLGALAPLEPTIESNPIAGCALASPPAPRGFVRAAGVLVRRECVTNRELAAWIEETSRIGASPWGSAQPPRGEESSVAKGVFVKDARLFAAWRSERLLTPEEIPRVAKVLRLEPGEGPAAAGVLRGPFRTVSLSDERP